MFRLLISGRACALSCAITLTILGFTSGAKAGKPTVLHTFAGSPADGALPFFGLLEDVSGNLYGTTTQGGTQCQDYGGCGTVFKLTSDGTETILYNFCTQANCVDGYNPWSNLIEDGDGNLYGTTLEGGANGDGTVFKLAPDGTETVLYSFCSLTNCADGTLPEGGLVIDQAGNLYGTTTSGGTSTGPYCGCGTVFKITPNGAETVLHSFCSASNCADGLFPMASVIADSAGNLYGTTIYGGSGTGYSCYGFPGCGTVFKIDTSGNEKVLYSFCAEQNCPDGMEPESPLLIDSSNNLYGTSRGGTGTYCSPPGCGIVFKVAPDGTETVLFSFCNEPSCVDGANPYNAGVVADRKGNLYGSTIDGGKNPRNPNGTLYRITRKGKEFLLGTFDKSSHGFDPVGTPIANSTGTLFGTTQLGGDKRCNPPYGCGVIFSQKE